jgi:hypothetical protein
MNDSGVTQGGDALVKHYEVLRNEAVCRDGQRICIRGLALFMRQGMAAWMRSVNEQPVSAPLREVCDKELPLPMGVEQSVVDILAAMAWATSGEVFCDLRSPLQSASPPLEAQRVSLRTPVNASTGV